MSRVEDGDAGAEVDVALALDVPHLRIRGTVGVDGQRVRDSPRNGFLAAVVQVGIRVRQGGSPRELGNIVAPEDPLQLAFGPTGKRRFERDYDRRRHHWRRPLRPVPGIRAWPARYQRPPGRFPAHSGRPVRGAVSGEADLRYSGAAGMRCPGARGPAHEADRAVQAGVPPRRGSRRICASRGWAFQGRHDRGQGIQRRRRGDRRRRGLVPAAAHRHRGSGCIRRHGHSLQGEELQPLPRQAPGDFRRRRFRPGLGAGAAAQSSQCHARSPPLGIPRSSRFSRQDEGAGELRDDAALRGPAACPSVPTAMC